MRVVSFRHEGAAPEWVMLSWPHADWGAVFLIGAALVLGAAFLLASRAGSTWLARSFAACVLLTAAARYFGGARFLDEVFVNLEHSWNLFHHGVFSFSPSSRVLGTVEALYYLLLAPFAWTHASLVAAAFWAGLALAAGHVLLGVGLLKSGGRPHEAIFLLPLVLHPGWGARMGDGFASAFFSILFAAAAYFYVEGKTRRAYALASLMGAVRPEGAAYFLIFCAADAWTARRISARRVALGLLPAAAYAVFVKLYSGHWIATPALFKASGLPLSFNPQAALHLAGVFLAKPMNAPALLLVLLALRREASPAAVFLRRTVVLMAVCVVAAAGMDRYAPRYSCVLQTSFLLLAAVSLRDLLARWRDRSGALARPALGAFVLFLAAAGAAEAREFTFFRERLPRVAWLGVGGQLVDRVTPPDWRVAATELNAFGFMNDREVLDLWGYTNRAIAASPARNAAGRPVRPGYFLAEAPDVFWSRTIWLPGSPYAAFQDERYLAARNYSKRLNNLGDMNKVLARYTPVKIYHQDMLTSLLVRNDRMGAFEEALVRNGFRRLGERPLDTESFARHYEASA